MRTIAITGSASGIGLSTRNALEEEGARIVGIDLRDAEVKADLSTKEGREGALQDTLSACGGQLDGFVACAGISGIGLPGSLTVAVNYFGAVELLEGLLNCARLGLVLLGLLVDRLAQDLLERVDLVRRHVGHRRHEPAIGRLGLERAPALGEHHAEVVISVDGRRDLLVVRDPLVKRHHPIALFAVVATTRRTLKRLEQVEQHLLLRPPASLDVRVLVGRVCMS